MPAPDTLEARVRFIELISSAGEPIARLAAHWDGEGFVIDPTEPQVTDSARFRFIDADGNAIGEAARGHRHTQ